jgi:hypothetical protein
MNTQIIAVSESVLPVCGIAVFVILFVVIHASLKQSQMFQDRSVTVLSACVSLLCVIGMYQTFFTPETGQDLSKSNGHPGVISLMVPYAALGIALLAMLLLMLLAKLFGSGKTDKCVKKVLPAEPKYPSERVPEPFIPIDLPINLNRDSRPKPSVKTDYLNQTSRNINSIEQMKPNPKPSDSKGIRHEK